MTAGTGNRVVQITNIAPQATRDQMQTLFGYLGKIEDIRLYPTIRDVAVPVQSRICYVKFQDPVCVSVAQHMTNTVFIDRALIVIPWMSGEIPDEQRALEMTNQGTMVPGLFPVEPKLPQHVSNQLEGMPPNQVVTTHDPRLQENGLPLYPPLPATLDARRIEEIRRTLLIANVEEATTTQEMIDFFSQAGEVKYFRFCSREGEGNPYALLEFSDQNSIIEALKMNGRELSGRDIKVYHATQAIVKPQAKSNEAAQREIEEAMSRVKEAQNLISAAIDPVIGLLAKEKKRSRSGSRSRRSRTPSSRRRSRSRSRRTRSGSRRRRSHSRRSRSRSRDRRRKSRSPGRRRKSRSRSRSHGRRSRSRDRRSKSKSSKSSHSKSHDKSKDKKDSKNRKDDDKAAENGDRESTIAQLISETADKEVDKLKEKSTIPVVPKEKSNKDKDGKDKSSREKSKRGKSPSVSPSKSRHRSPSRRKSRSPARRKSRSPSRRKSPARPRRRSGSRTRRRSKSPPRRHSPASRKRSRSPAKSKKDSERKKDKGHDSEKKEKKKKERKEEKVEKEVTEKPAAKVPRNYDEEEEGFDDDKPAAQAKEKQSEKMEIDDEAGSTKDGSPENVEKPDETSPESDKAKPEDTEDMDISTSP